jgi:1-acyl-sn-glycerol-3-phosphate acyltransferase
MARVRWVGTGLSFGFSTFWLWLSSRFFEGRQIHFLMRFACSRTLAVAGVRLRPKGLENLPRDRGYLLVCNHVNSLDPMIVYSLVPRHVVALEKASHFSWPLYGPMIARWGNLPVARGDAERSARSLELAAALMRAGTPVFVFPEGTRSRDGRLAPFRRGAFALALQARVPLIPLVIKGADNLYREGTTAMYGGDQEVVVLPPVSLESYGPGDEEALAAVVRELIIAEMERA